MSVKYIFVTGGVVSGLGKGITAASLGRLLKARGLRVTIQKFDPYINVDPGTMSPYQHGEVFVTDDGAETDLDLGHYERFIDENLNKNSNITTGKIYWSIINKERKGDFLGGTVQVIPHVTNEIKNRIYLVGKNSSTDVVITEIGGTVGDIESLPFLEAIRQVASDVGRENVVYIHVTLVPYLGKSGELKTKPTQHSVKELRSLGIQPDIIVCRTEKRLSKEMKDKIGLFCNIPGEWVIQNLDAETLYEVPLMLEEEGLANIVCKRLSLNCVEPDMTEWCQMVNKQKNLSKSLTIALVGKYVELHDAYLSVVESLNHGGISNDAEINIKWINSEELNEDNFESSLSDVDGILVPGGFGDRGIEGKILAAKYARENKVPYFGICLGMQMAVVEFARNVAGLKMANSSEFDTDSPYPVIDIMPDQKDIDEKGGTMRLGLYPCKIKKDSITYSVYGDELIYERHRHRYEFNNEYRELLVSKGLVFAGLSPSEKLVEIIELKDHPWFIGVQFHPEFKSRPNRPHPLFRDFIRAAVEKRYNR
ncbi:CTP synthase [Acetivibrio mesophilus]|uniref:CTP synthase n=1 Tax=Acetivibrio mesophilus TaxID=2487273 RepID=A0A4Q0I7D0_9FIRM|nr:CTP synthase [Acetivibrio mesophilus]RXE58912.1 CTP synthase [Acetivibrio mesophilus]